jgi:hypothetical protein
MRIGLFHRVMAPYGDWLKSRTSFAASPDREGVAVATGVFVAATELASNAGGSSMATAPRRMKKSSGPTRLGHRSPVIDRSE